MPQPRRARQDGSAALERLRASLEAAENALKDLQGEVSRNSRDLLKDVGKTLTTARRNLTRSRGRIIKDIEQIQQALVTGKAGRPAASSTRKAGASKRRRTKRTAKRAASKPVAAAGAKRATTKAKRKAKAAASKATSKAAAGKSAASKRAAPKRTARKRTGAKRTGAKSARRATLAA